MVFEEKSKYRIFYQTFGCPTNIKIPTNDLDAWLTYKDHNWVYNRLMIAQLQSIDAAPMPIRPRHYPVILKPITNMYGMGLGIHKINNDTELQNYWYSNEFWMEYLEGEHISCDILLIDGKVQWHCCFLGYPMENNPGSFKYWESIDMPLPEKCNLLINKIGNHTGCINIELIGGNMIECHLRMGDITKLPNDEIIRGIISIYQGKPYKFPESVPKIFLFPIWIDKSTDSSIIKKLDKKVIETICKNAYSYQIDSGTEATPSNLRRIMMISTIDYEIGMSICKDIYHYLYRF